VRLYFDEFTGVDISASVSRFRKIPWQCSCRKKSKR